MQTLANEQQITLAAHAIREFISAHPEWFLTQSENNTQAVRREELDLSLSQGRLIISSWTEKGIRSWKVAAWEIAGDRLSLRTSRRMGAERNALELIPRASAAAIAATVRAARQVRCEQIAQLACAQCEHTKVERIALSPGIRRGQPGRYTRIILRARQERIAVTANVASTNKVDIDAQLTSALIWYLHASDRSRPPYIKRFWLVLEEAAVKLAQDRLALLRDGLRNAIQMFQINEAWQEVIPIPLCERVEVFKKRLARFPRAVPPETSECASRLISIAPEAIDVVHARHGETLRYYGLPFARVRTLMGVSRVWFGLGANRRILEASSQNDWENLLKDLLEHRSATSLDHHHAMYSTASESWLESLLRRDITRLDPGLIIAPLHAQFRTARGGRVGVRPIDLLALRQDGRLVVIELKVTEDREHVLQGADYWRRVEAHRRRGHIARARLFGDLKISEQSPLVYLVAPTLRFHRSFRMMARTIDPEIEIYRFDINEDWRAGVRVMRRLRVN
jgi:hypothetical protein